MIIFAKKKKHILMHLQGALVSLEKALTSYLEYLNTGKIEYWEDVVMPRSFFMWNIAKWHDEDTYPDKTEYFGRLCDIHSLLVTTEFDPKNRHKFEDKDLEYFFFLKKEITKLFIEEAVKIDWNKRNLREFIITLSNFEPESDNPKFPEMFIERLKKLNLLGKHSEAA